MSGAAVKRKMDKNGATWEYLEKGHPRANNPSMLFIHGFSSRKEDWTPILMVRCQTVKLNFNMKLLNMKSC